MSNPAARRYARAMYLLGTDEHRVDAMLAELRRVAEAVRESQPLRDLLASPVVSPHDRRVVMSEVLTRLGILGTVRNAVMLLTDRRRGAMVPDVADALARLSDEKAGKVLAEVTSTVALTDAQAAKLSAALEKLTGRKITLTRKVDPTLLGGVVTRIGDTVYDGSVRTRLQEIRQATVLPS